MKIGLMGFELESPNKGCEALSYALVDYLNLLQIDDLTILVLDSEDVGGFKSWFPQIRFEAVPFRIKDPTFRSVRAIKKCDLVFDITMGDSFSDIYSKEYCKSLIKRKVVVELLNKKYVLMPQTYGPFDDAAIRKKAIKVIENAYKVYSRDVASIEYLKQFGVNKEITECIDLAFMLPFDNSMFAVDRAKRNLGINISGLLWKGGFISDNQFDLTIDYKEYIRKVIKELLLQGWSVHLIPHVLDAKDDAHDDDYRYIEMLHEEFPNTVIAPRFSNPIEAKSYIACMDCFIGARMHSTIAAFSTGVGVIPVSYSRKFEGVYERLGYKYVINARKLTTDAAILKTLEYVDKNKELRTSVNDKKIIIDTRIDTLKNEIRKLVLGD